jgi:hypothetical protein
MGLIGLLWGIVSLLGMLLAFIPLLGWGNWLTIPFAVCGLIVSGIAYGLTSPERRGRATMGVWLNALAILIGLMRLSLGGGVI